MITVPTTLVLGAGASKPYGFPSGHELRQLLCSPAALNGMYQCGFDQRDLEAFSSAFLKSGMPSIDAFLARRGKHKVGSLTDATYADIGKAAIAYRLIQCERPESIHVLPDDHWYQYLWSFISDSLDSFGENKLHIITFNYDRSLEYYLLTSLQHSFGITAQEAAEYLQKIPILHVYGQLATLPELPLQGYETRRYHPDVSIPAYIEVAARGIRVIDESRDDDEVFEKAYSYLRDAERICFLGFGFDPTNVRRLRIDELVQHARLKADLRTRVFATTLGLEAAERESIIHQLNTQKTVEYTHHSRINIESHGGMRAERYLRATGVFIS
ncbi:MAG: hypothetical protein WA056_09520 [Gallionella sp.]